jgi:creatinine amidohydrolase
VTHLGPRTWTEVADDRPTTLLVPLGSTEQHGPHLPLDTDTRVAVAWCEALAEGRPGVVVGPAIPVGSSGEHEGFPGTISIGQEALEVLAVELVRSATRWVDEVVLVCGHGGNAEPVRRAVDLLVSEGRRVHALFPRLAGDAHAGRTETSLLLHVAPDVVRLDRAEAGCTVAVSDLMEVLRRSGLAEVAPNGVLGDPTGASADEGRRLLQRLVAVMPEAGRPTATSPVADGVTVGGRTPALVSTSAATFPASDRGERRDEDAGSGAVGSEPGLEDRRGRDRPAEGG